MRFSVVGKAAVGEDVVKAEHGFDDRCRKVTRNSCEFDIGFSSLIEHTPPRAENEANLYTASQEVSSIVVTSACTSMLYNSAVV